GADVGQREREADEVHRLGDQPGGAGGLQLVLLVAGAVGGDEEQRRGELRDVLSVGRQIAPLLGRQLALEEAAQLDAVQLGALELDVHQHRVELGPRLARQPARFLVVGGADQVVPVAQPHLGDVPVLLFVLDVEEHRLGRVAGLWGQLGGPDLLHAPPSSPPGVSRGVYVSGTHLSRRGRKGGIVPPSMSSPSSTASPRVRRALTWAVAALPILVFGAVFAVHRLPDGVRAASVDLTGEYLKSANDDPAYAQESFQPQGWDKINLPMFVPGAQSAVWARRHFTLPPELVNQPLFFMAGSFWPGTEVYINGQRVGAQDLYTRGVKPEIFGFEGWEVPAGVARAGDNVLALRMTSLVVWDNRIILGAREPVRDYFLRNSDLKKLILHGQLLLLAFFMALVAIFWRQEEDKDEKARYGITLHLLAASAFYTGLNVGVGGMKELTPFNTLLYWLSIIYFTGCLFEWTQLYVLHRKGRARLVFRAVYAAQFALLTGLWVTKSYAGMYQAWPPV